MTRGTEGYAAESKTLISRYESVPFEARHRKEMHLLPSRPGRVADIGAGTGIDAAWLAQAGHAVTAVEPVAEFREAGRKLHPSPRIEWVDDSLPLLEKLVARRGTFDLVMMTAVWMHFDAPERETAMPNVAALLSPGGKLILSLRHGPVPEGRRMFDVTAEETTALAKRHGLETLLNVRAESAHEFNRQAGVTWSCLAFRAT